MRLGSDICSIKRIAAVYEQYGEKFLDKILTADEKAYVLSSPKHLLQRLAGRFAAKEATSKALGTGFKGVAFKEIEVTKLGSGEPRLRLHGRASDRAQLMGLSSFELTTSHEDAYAIAFVIAQ